MQAHMRTVLALLSTLALFSSCGTPCSRVATAESAADDKGSGCNSTRNAWTTSKTQTCESNLKTCSPNDTKQLDLYASCLQALPACAEGQRSSWELQRAACAVENLLFKVSAGCASGL